VPWLFLTVLVVWLIFRKGRATGPELDRLRDLVVQYAEKSREYAAERIRVRALAGAEREQALAGLELIEVQRLRAETNMIRWRASLEKRGYDVRGVRLPSPEEAEDAVWLAEGEREVERLLTE
jgi:hypothetical protein